MGYRSAVFASIFMFVSTQAPADGVLGSLSTSASEIRGNVVRESGIERATELETSFSGHRGLASVNQSAGVLTNQSNIRSIAIGAGAIAAAESEVKGAIRDNSIEVSGGFREDVITGSFVDTRGIVGVNQASGIATSQTNSLALAVDTRSLAALPGTAQSSDPQGLAEVFVDVGAEALDDEALDASVSGNERQGDPELPRHERLTDSFSGFRGIAQVSQSAGDLNQISNRASISVVTITP